MKLKLTKKELFALSRRLDGAAVSLEDGKLVAKVHMRIKELANPAPKLAKIKFMTKKEREKVLSEIMPKGKITNRTEFLGGIRDRINASLAN